MFQKEQSHYKNPVSTRLSPHLEQDIFKKLKDDFSLGRFSYMGRKEDFILVFVTMCSSIHAHSNSISMPLGSFIIGETSTGKTELLYSVAKLFPQNCQVNMSTLSSKSFFYHCKENPDYLNGKIILVEELTGIKDESIQYLLRILVTKGKALHSTVIRGKAEEIPITGAISLQSTGLNEDILRDDTMNRLFSLYTDSSTKMTGLVIDHIKDRYCRKFSKSTDDYFIDYHKYFKSLKPFKVDIPYVRRIKFDTSTPDCRRKAKIFLDMLATVTIMNQHVRHVEDGMLVATESDFYSLHELLKKVKPIATKRLNLKEQTVLDTIEQIENHECITYEDILNKKPSPPNGKPYDRTTVSLAMKGLKEKRLVESSKDGRSTIFSYLGSRSKATFGVLGLDIAYAHPN